MKHTNRIGVDVSDSSIKVLKLGAEGTVVAYGSGSLAPGIVERGRIIDREAFSKALRAVLERTRPETLYSETNPPRSVLCLPESKLFTHYLTVPDEVGKAELSAYVRDDAEKIIPFEIDQLYWDYHVAEEKGKRSATFVAVAKKDLDAYVSAFTSAGVKPAFVGGELFSLGNALLPQGTLEEDYMIVDIGAHATTVGIFSTDAIANASVKIPLGGEYFTRTVSEKKTLSLEEAERQKRQYGLDASFEDTTVPAILRECLKEITHKIGEAKDFFEKKTGSPIKHIVLAGGSALLPGISTFIGTELGIDTKVADPLAKVKHHEIFEKETPSILFANVIGLALYGVQDDRSRINLLTQYRYHEGVSEKEVLRVGDIRSLSDFYYVTYSLFQTSKDVLSGLVRPFRKKLLRVRATLALAVLFLTGALGFLAWVFITYL